MKKIFFILIIFFLAINLFAQEIPKFEKKSYRDNENNLYWNKSVPVYISLSSTPDGSNAEKLESKKSEKYADPFYFDTEGLNFIRTRWAIDKNTGKFAKPKQEIMWEVFADGKSPKTKINYSYTNKYIINNETVYRTLKIKFSSFDQTSKVKDIYYSIDGGDYVKYNGEFVINAEGVHTIKYFAVDNVGNAEEVKEIKFKIDLTPPITNCTVTGVKLGEDNVVSSSTKIYLNSTDDISGIEKIYYQIDSLPLKTYSLGANITLKTLNDGDHVLKFYSVDKVGNKETEQTFSFFLDKTAPISVSDILGDKFIVGEKIYFSGRTKFKITSIDNKAGVKDVLYSIDGEDFKHYDQPFYMPNEPGWHTVKYFAIDSTENITIGEYSKKYFEYQMKVDKIYVDLNGPNLSHFISGDKYFRGDSIFINSNSKINLSASDKESGLQFITYSIDGELKETPYNEPFNLPNAISKKYKIEYFGYDNVNNRNTKSFEIILDNDGPKIEHKFGILPISINNNLESYPKGVILFLTAQDNSTGIKNIFYKINGSQFTVYKNYIKNLKMGKNIVNVEAYDKLDNKSSYQIEFNIE